MTKSWHHWNMSAQGMALNQSFISSRKWTWMEKMPILCLSIWKKSSRSLVMTPWPSCQIQNLLFGVLWWETTCHGTLRSSWSALRVSPTSAIAEDSLPATWRQILKSFLKMSSKLLNNMRSLAVKVSVTTSFVSDLSVSYSGIIFGQKLLQFKYRPTLSGMCPTLGLYSLFTEWRYSLKPFSEGSFWWNVKDWRCPCV